MDRTVRALTVALCAVFFTSGAAGLVFETLWFQQAGLAFGNSVWASSLVLAGYMGGLACGNVLGARFADRSTNPLAFYAWLEFLVGASGVALVFFLPSMSASLAPLRSLFEDQPLVLNTTRFTAAFVLLALPSTAMGATLPLLTRALGAKDAHFGRVLGLLYASNTLGAVAGVAATEAFFVEAFGIRGASFCAAGLNFLAAVVAFRLAPSLRVPAGPGDRERLAPDANAASSWSGPARILLAAFLSGLTLLALEVVWLRALLLFLSDTPTCFAVILGIVLVGIAFGGYLGSLWTSVAAEADRHVGVVAYAAGIAGIGGFALMPAVMDQFWQIRQDAAVVMAVSLPLMLVVSILSGVLFTLLGVRLKRMGGSPAAISGRLTFANTLGAAIGPLLGGFVLLPLFGVERSLLLLCASYGVIGLLLVTTERVAPAIRYGATLAFCLGLAAFPFGMGDRLMRASAEKWMDEGSEIVEVREGLTGTLIHVQHKLDGLPIYRRLATNAYSMSTTDYISRRYMKLYVYLPLALHPGMENALLVGYGMGNTAKAMTDTEEFLQIDIVDISADILDMGRLVYPDPAELPQNDPRVRVHLEDGRHFLQSTDERYDLITGEPPPPVVAGVVNLYSREYFELIHDRLNEGGIVSYWLPMMNITAETGKAIIRAFCDAFSDCSLWHGGARNLMLLGTRDGQGGVDAERFAKQFERPEIAREMKDIGFEAPVQLATTFIGDAHYLDVITDGVEALVDDQPKRLQQYGADDEKARLMAHWRDAEGARARFASSGFVDRFVPASLREDVAPHFENQRVFNDFIFSSATAKKGTRLLHHILTRTPFEVTPQLILDSDPDIQRALREASPEKRADPRLRLHVAVGHLVERDYEAALEALADVADADLPLRGLRSYLEAVVDGRVQGVSIREWNRRG